MNIPVLMYHGIHDVPGRDGCFEPVYSVTRQQFERHLRWLADNNYRTATVAEIFNCTPKEKTVVITFDDGDLSNYTVALPVLQKYQMTAEYFITTDWIDTEHYMTRLQLRTLDEAGMSIQSHAKSHRYLNDLAEEDLARELVGSKHVLEQILDRKVIGLALPGGRGGDKVVQVAREAGYLYVCNSELGINFADGDPFALKRIAVTRQTGMEQFKSLVRGDRWEIGKRVLRQRALGSMKTMLGNRLYEKLRSRLLD